MNSPELFVQSRNAMGTVFTIYLYARDQEQAEPSLEAAFEEIERLEETLSTYRATSEISRINRLAGNGEVTTDPEVFALLEKSLHYSRQSHGAFDVTVGSLMRAWGFFRGQGRYPTSEELRWSRDNVGWEKVQLDPATRRVHFAAPGLELDLGAIGKGYAVDRVVKVLREAGLESALIDAGSSTLHAMSAPPGKDGWTVHVPMPRERSKTVSTVTLRNESLSTSGSYENFFRLDGRTYCHVMDPRTGAPVQGVAQTSLIASDSTTSDALSNAMFVLGPEAGKQLLATLNHSRGLWALNGAGAEAGAGPESLRWVQWKWQDCTGNEQVEERKTQDSRKKAGMNSNLSRFAGVSEVPAEREPAGEILSGAKDPSLNWIRVCSR